MAGISRIRACDCENDPRLLAVCREVRRRPGAQVCDPHYGSIAVDAYDYRVTFVWRNDILESSVGIQERVVGGFDHLSEYRDLSPTVQPVHLHLSIHNPPISLFFTLDNLG